MSFSWPLGRPWERERKRALMVEVSGSVWKKKEFRNCWNFGKWNPCGLWRKERNKEKGKRKRIDKEKIFSLTRKMKLLETQIPGFKSRIRKTFWKIPKSSEIQVSRNDS